MEKLLGDITQDALKKIGADKIARYYERVTGRACNCGNRAAMLNNLHRAAQRMIERQKIVPKQAVAVVVEPIVNNNIYQQPTKPVDE